ncbi:RsfA family transcriptional regulator [Pseudalkalibacillus caeni]|uniref:RsfA family transcriptional regulator n=2 Tax=Exobacillus caeni TaxID=2574798 RepID=A0A5R9FEX9_9BACL|nr:RsfA family transcriptional regulator [Pseudalkalibacillus caeni]
MKVRQDAWSHEDDLLLAETVLRHVREGSTQLKAFDEVGDKLNRTSAAVGFRWNAIVRQRYEQALKIAKKQRKEFKRAGKIPSSEPVRAEAPTSEAPGYETTERETTREYQAPSFQRMPVQSSDLSLDEVISFLSQLKRSHSNTSHLQSHVEKLEYEKKELEDKNKEMERKLQKLEKEYQIVQEDYQSLIQIMDRARRMVLFQEEEYSNSSFKMDKNGNLEKMAK